MKLICMILGHRRSGRRATLREDGQWHSRCRRCHRRMVRVGSKKWVLERADRSEPAEPTLAAR